MHAVASGGDPHTVSKVVSSDLSTTRIGNSGANEGIGDNANVMNAVAQTQTFRRTSAIKWFGLPLYDFYFPDQNGDLKSLDEATARGFLAVGLSAKGIVAARVLARGVFAFGVCSVGVVSVGVCSVGLLLL
jgi:hypothetical protein